MTKKAIIPSEENPYIAVWQDDNSLFIELISLEDPGKPIKIELDKNILPDLVDALLDIQNSPE